MHNANSASRRNFVKLASMSTLSVAVSGSTLVPAADTQRRETADLITGPFYPVQKPRDSDTDLTFVRGHKNRASGQVVRLSGRVLTLRGEPVRNARIEIWQANTHGRYTHPSDPNVQAPLDPDFDGYAQLRTDRDGHYAITTIKPGAYPTARGDMRSPHIHFEIQGNVDRKVTQLFFPGERLNEQDRHLNSVRRPETLMADVLTPATSGGVLVATWNIVLTNG